SNMFVMLGTPHCPQSGIGTVIRIDTTQDIRTRAPMTYITPYVDIRQEPGWNQYENGKWRRHTRGPLYMDPYPLSEDLFLVAHNPDKQWDDPSAYGLYLINATGVHQAIHVDPEISCWQPTPLRVRAVPPVLSTPRDEELAAKQLAVCFVHDIYQGMEGIERGQVKYIRVMEQIPRPWDCRQFWDGVGHTDLISRGTALAAKAMHGIVPVYEDGSAHFYVPADRNIYFQALDENFMELQRERTYVNYRPGEMRSCVGCHEKPNNLPAKQGSAIAMEKAPVMPGPQPGDATGRQVIHFPSYVQPVLDRHCVTCHGDREPEAGFALTGTMTDRFSRSYENIMRRGLVKTYREASDWGGSPYSPPKTIGSHASRFITVLREGEQHKDLNLPLADFARLATWVDASGVYYGSYWGRRRLKYRNHPNFRPIPTFDEALSTVCPLPVDQR
ncbi:MAG: HzsA-related protein, partial [Planctomycetota bacterium]